MLRAVCFALLLSLVVGLELKAKLNSQWQKFKSAHGKHYSPGEEGKRQLVFKKNVEAILQHNLDFDLGEATFSQGVNEFSDMSHDEFVKKMCGVRGNRHNKTNEEVFMTERASVPDKVDWRDSNIVGPVKNQLSCGSCWSFSATGAIESAWAKAKGKLEVLSEQQMVDCSLEDQYDNAGCDGGWPYQAMKYIIDNGGQMRDSCYRYQAYQGYCHYDKSCKAATISKYVELKPGNEESLKQAVATVGPISVCVDAGQPDFQSYRRGVYDPRYCSQDTNHAVLLTGYGTEGGKDYWLVKNSWGSSWGEMGYFKLARNANNKCGITNDAVYAVV